MPGLGAARGRKGSIEWVGGGGRSNRAGDGRSAFVVTGVAHKIFR